MIAGHVDDARAFLDFAQDQIHDAAMVVVPEPASAQTPAVDDIADEIECVAVIVREKIREHFSFAAARAQMGVGDEDGAVARETGGAGAGGRGSVWARQEGGEASAVILEPQTVAHAMPPGLFMTGRLGASHDSFVARRRRSRDGKLNGARGLVKRNFFRVRMEW